MSATGIRNVGRIKTEMANKMQVCIKCGKRFSLPYDVKVCPAICVECVDKGLAKGVKFKDVEGEGNG
jgi:hypothetical protein